jgi:acyl-CoA thioesterase I
VSTRLATALALLLLLLASGVARAVDTEPVIAVLGDSLTAGLGVAVGDAFPARLQARLHREGYRYRVVNAGVSGDTSASGLRRVEWVLRSRPEIVIVALGANDGLRGLGTAAMQSNLMQIVERLRAASARVLLAGMRVPPNYGDDYARRFADSFAEVATRTGVTLMPFLLTGVAGDSALNQPDGIHPTAGGHSVIADNVWTYLKPLLKRYRTTGGGDVRPTPR